MAGVQFLKLLVLLLELKSPLLSGTTAPVSGFTLKESVTISLKNVLTRTRAHGTLDREWRPLPVARLSLCDAILELDWLIVSISYDCTPGFKSGYLSRIYL